MLAGADGHRVPRLGTLGQQFVLDADAVEPVGEITDRLRVGEIRLPNPAFGLGAANPPDLATLAISLPLDGELGSVARHRLGPDHDAGTRSGVVDGPARRDDLRHRVGECRQPLTGHGRDEEDL